MKKILFIAGEPSGDQHAAPLISAIKKRMPELDAFGVGGPQMEKAGLRLIHNITELSVIGIIEPIKNLPRLFKIRNDLLRHVEIEKPDAIVFIDYPGFNIRLAKKTKKLFPEIPVIYFVSPQIWAWGHRRIHAIRRVVDLMLVFFPFEVDVYNKGGKWVVENDTISIKEHHFIRKSNMVVKCVGHPLTAKLKSFVPDNSFLNSINVPNDKCIIGILPGSRDNEIKKILPVMLQSAEKLREKNDDLFFIISCARPGLKNLIAEKIKEAGITDFDKFYRVVPESMYDIAYNSKLIIVTSGTAALETALMHKPVLVLYKANFITFCIGRALFSIPFINLANIIAGKRIVPEFIQHQMTPERIVPVAEKYLTDKNFYNKTVEEIKKVHDLIGHGNTGELAAEEICKFLKCNSSL